eukprot:c7009_g1_i1.p1 GENE.c7009_g1_i1~~c7009_g1_i1.p1  ORF type:complete len:1146 (+),score=341.15 c7009_g1_i1:104-3541(+)
MSFPDLTTDEGLKALNDHLESSSYIAGPTPTSLDVAIYDHISKVPEKYPHAMRWFLHIRSFTEEEMKDFPKPTKARKAKTGGEMENTTRRDRLLDIQTNVQSSWDAQKVFESHVPQDTSKPKFFGCFPYPYMNGILHLGHTFTLSKVEFAVGFQRMLGKEAFFPFAFHCTGMPIQACANKLKSEIARFGNPPVFPRVEEPDADAPAPAPVAPAGQKKKEDITQFSSAKSKAGAKKGKEVWQWDIMKSLGFSDTDIPSFQDPLHWLQYFPPVAQKDIAQLGCKIDWRRSFITTDVNPYYDSFIQWQFWTLKRLDKVKFGKRFSVWSPKDGQPCADHDRAAGEGHGPQEYTIIKMEVPEQFLTGALAPLKKLKKKVFLAAATLRPETMYGQTNCWVSPTGEYGAFEINDTTIYILTERAALNLSFQDRSPKWGETKCVLKLSGQDLIGVGTRSPNCTYDIIYTLPMLTINTAKTTGVVTSVPSDSPDDYMALEDLRNKEGLRKKFNVKDEWVLPFHPIPIIQVKDASDLFAVQVCKEMGIQSQNDRKQLADAHDVVYKRGYYFGTMKVGKYQGMKVEEAKPLIRKDLIDQGLADVYAEPAGEVISRSGDVCVVALCDQWYLDYGEANWLSQTTKALKGVECYHEEVRKQFETTLGWLNQWACSRQFGLGTKLPWDKQWLIESLSDSTIYMAFYTVSHLLQKDMFGTEPGTLGIKPEQLTTEVWDHVFLDAPYPDKCGIPKEKLASMKHEFNYWYPVDLRVSGKDLIQNHLTFFMYNHTAIFPEKFWPKGIRCNGHLLLDNEKMSKSTGNFMTMRQAVDKYSADATRMALADAGDGIDDANFLSGGADVSILRLTTLVDLCQSLIARSDTLRTTPYTFLDKWFDSSIRFAVTETHEHYQKGLFREALRTGYFDLSNAFGIYTTALVDTAPHKDLVYKYIEIQTLMLAPITPHTCEFLWQQVLKKSGLVVNASWPQVEPADKFILDEAEYLFSTARDLRLILQRFKNPKKGPKLEPTEVTIYVAKEYPDWQFKTLTVLKNLYKENNNVVPGKDQYLSHFTEDAALKSQIKKIMAFASFVLEKAAVKGEKALETTVPFNEIEILRMNLGYLSSTLDGVVVTVTATSDACPAAHVATRDQALPLSPSAFFA